MDTRKIEEKAVHAVQSMIDQCDVLSPCFNTQDRQIAIDGHIEVYNSSKLKTRNCVGEIPVQIKGRAKKSDTPNHVKYLVDISDLKFFMQEDGAIFFVVCGLESLAPNIFYKILLPYDLAKILDDVCNCDQKTKQIKLKPFPNEPSEICRICNEFLQNRKKQSTLKNIGIKTPEELKKGGVDIEFFEFDKTLLQGELPTSIKAYQNGTYIYARSPLGESYAIDKIENLVEIQSSRETIIAAGDVSIKTTVTVEEKTDGNKRISFAGFEISQNHDRATSTFKDSGTFRTRYENTRFAIALSEVQSLSIAGQTFDFKFKFDDVNAIADLKERASMYAECVKLLDKLFIKVDWDIDKLTQEEIYSINILYDGIIKEEPLTVDSPPTLLSDVNIGEYRIKVLLEKQKDGSFRLVDLLNPKQNSLILTYKGEGQEKYNCPIPSLLIFNVDDYSHVCNIDHTRFSETLEKAPISQESSEFACQGLLNMLSAYDKSSVCPGELIKCAKCLSEYILKVDPENSVYIVNYLQVKKRLGILAENDRKKLSEIAIDPTNGNEYSLQAAIHILLDNQEMAYACLEHLSASKRAEFENWPIFNLLEFDTKMKK